VTKPLIGECDYCGEYGPVVKMPDGTDSGESDWFCLACVQENEAYDD